ncbi:hypothetical protein FQR65_LT03730 [Abscondita terminalis]|nr:hypothetical protein FQR65_LT03730 [Abscondita terminalis]
MSLPNAFVIFSILVAYYYIQGCDSSLLDDLIISTPNGRLKGTVHYSRSNKSFLAFKGIPYAKPPVGHLRFKAPEQPDPWKGIRMADKDGPMCIQKNYLLYERPPVEGKEDCLYINVYKPKSSHSKDLFIYKRRLPVMVFIHYGGFFAGTGNSDYIGPEYIMDKNVILVTFNYRLGVFGFLSTNDDASPGNWALKDQAAALKWVKSNIVYFGGNCDKITIFGQSAGAGSVHYHLLSPITKNLFHRAISQSGSTLSLWARPKNVLQALIAQQQALFVNCDPSVGMQAMVTCLRNVDASVLANSSDLFKTFSTEPYALYGPVTEVKTPLNPEPYITEDPLNLIQEGRFHKVPWIVGVVEDEGILRASPLLRQKNTQTELNSNFDKIGSEILGIGLSVPPDQVSSVWNRITNYFIGDNYVNVTEPEDVQGFINLYSDRAFTYGSYQSALLHAWRGHSPVWFYNFAYKGEYSYENHFAATQETINFNWGVSHCDDLLYLFPSKKLFKPLESANDIRMSKIMVQMWTNFAINGNPTPVNSIKSPSAHWISIENLTGQESVKNSDLVYLNISGPYSEKEGSPIRLENSNRFNTDRMLFWKSLPLSENIDGIN